MNPSGGGRGVGEIFCIRPDRPWSRPSLLYNGYRVSFPGVHQPERCADHPPHVPLLPLWPYMACSMVSFNTCFSRGSRKCAQQANVKYLQHFLNPEMCAKNDSYSSHISVVTALSIQHLSVTHGVLRAVNRNVSQKSPVNIREG